MKNILSKVFLVAVGTVIGSAVTWKITKTKYEQIAQAEIDSVKETYARVYSGRNEESDRAVENEERYEDAPDEYYEEEPDLEFDENYEVDEAGVREAEKIAKRAGYVDTGEENYDEKEENNDMIEPYVIHPDEFGDPDFGHEQSFLTLYADGFIDNDFGDVLDEEDIERMLGGRDILKKMGGFEKDILCIRNENELMDYEITRDLRRYSEID